MIQRIHTIFGNIVNLDVDAIVNAANIYLLGGGGVDGAIHRAAGPELLSECRLLDGCKVGEAKVTKGYKLPAKFVIHTVGPRWSGGSRGEAELLASCYQNTMQLAAENGITSLAFPSISTGVYGYPIELAAQVALATISKYIQQHPSIESVTICCFSKEDLAVYDNIIQQDN